MFLSIAIIVAMTDGNFGSPKGSQVVQAASEGQPDMVAEALRAGTSPDERDSDGSPALFLAAVRGHISVVGLLLRSGANPNLAGPEGLTPLMGASNGGHAEVANELVAAGANVNAGDHNGTSALMYAVDARSVNVIELLIRSGANVRARNKYGQSALDRCRKASRSIDIGSTREGGPHSIFLTYQAGDDDPIVRMLRQAGAE